MSKSNQDPDQMIDELEEAMDEFDPDASAGTGAGQSDDPNAALLQQCAELEDKYKRVLADYRNLEHRVQNERAQVIKTANRWLIESLLEPLDFMEKATAHIDDKGLKMVTTQFYKVLEDEGLKEIKALGQQFDERTMEAIDTAAGDEGKVIEVTSKGFTLNDQVIRHAKVIVGNGKKGN
jgi:molecular chaperone GrpE